MADSSTMYDAHASFKPALRGDNAPSTPKKRFRKSRERDDGFVAATPAPIEATKTIITPTKAQRCGRWTFEEKLLFLHGLKVYGKGRWKKIRSFLPTRTLIQIKSHAQKVLKREEAGDDIFAPLNANPAKVQELISDLSALFETREGGEWGPGTPPLSSEVEVHSTCQPPAMLSSSCETMDARFRFTVGDTQPEMKYGGSAIYQATIGDNNVGFAFPPAPLHSSPHTERRAPRRPPLKRHITAERLGSLVLVPPKKKPKCTDVLAAAALCELSSIGRSGLKNPPLSNNKNGDGIPHIVSP